MCRSGNVLSCSLPQCPNDPCACPFLSPAFLEHIGFGVLPGTDKVDIGRFAPHAQQQIVVCDISRFMPLDAGTKSSLKLMKKLMKRGATVKYKEQEQAFNSLVEAAWAIRDPISADKDKVTKSMYVEMCW